MSLREIIATNFWWKLTSLLVATGIWFGFHSGDKLSFQIRDDFAAVNGTRDFVRHPITLMKNATDNRNARIEPKEVDIIVSGETDALRKISGKEIQAFVDLTEIKDDTTTVRIQVFTPRGIRLESVNPPQARLFFTKT